jgi:hypothetical protein
MLPNYQVTGILLGLFLRKFDVKDLQNFAQALPWRLTELDAEPVFGQVPPNAPPDVPRVRFASRDQRLVLDVGPAKLEFRMMPGDIGQNEQGQPTMRTLGLVESFERFIPQAMRIHTTLSEHFGATASRVGVLTDFIAGTASSANQRMQRALLAPGNHFGERLLELQIQTHSRPALDDGLSVNRRIHIHPIRTQQQGSPDLALGIKVDINTLAEEPYDLSTADLENFLNNVVKHLNEKVPLLHEKSLFE